MKRVVSIQDLSCIGKCSLTVALPVISAMGVECAVVPTALFSAHTAFDTFFSLDVSGQMDALGDQWRAMGLEFDAIYTGYLSSAQQVQRVCRWIERFRGEHTLVFVDPAMADDGKLYAGLSADFPAEMAKLCAMADVITPNLTEARMLTGSPDSPDPPETLLSELHKLGAKQALLTGVVQGDQIGIVGMHGSCWRPHLQNTRPGTGDLFASACVGAMVQGIALQAAAEIAADFVLQSIRLTLQNPDARWYGADFERALPFLIERVREERGYEAAFPV